MQDQVLETLQSFGSISLKGIECAKFMTRTEAKYQCRLSQLPDILKKARLEFKVLEIRGTRLSAYESLYLDTDDHQMYIDHHNGKLNRYKIRIREYLNTREFFLEIKKKDNNGKTEKKRIPISPDRDFLKPDYKNFISANSPYKAESLKPALTSFFNRITLVNHELSERVTIDILPAWKNNKKVIELNNLVIIEVKSGKATSHSGFSYLLREERIHTHRLSKYCAGTVLLYPELKHNRFKSKMLHLKKLDNNLVNNEPSITIN